MVKSGSNIAVRGLFIHCVIPKRIAASFLNETIGTMEVIEGILQCPDLSIPPLINTTRDGLSELRILQEEGYEISLPFAVYLLEFVAMWPTGNITVTDDWPGIIENFKEHQSQNCGLPLSFKIASRVIQTSLAIVALAVIFFPLAPNWFRKLLGLDNCWILWLFHCFLISSVAWSFVPVHHNGRLNWWKTLKLALQVMQWLGIYFFCFQRCMQYLCRKWHRLGILLLVHLKEVDEEEEGIENEQQAVSDKLEDGENRHQITSEHEGVNEQEAGIELREVPKTSGTETHLEGAETQPAVGAMPAIDKTYEPAQCGDSITASSSASTSASTKPTDRERMNTQEIRADLESGSKTAPKQSANETHREAAPTDIEHSTTFCFFITNLLVCILWYASRYDSIGTDDPSLTKAFG